MMVAEVLIQAGNLHLCLDSCQTLRDSPTGRNRAGEVAGI